MVIDYYPQLPGPGLEVIRNPKHPVEFRPLTVARNPAPGSRRAQTMTSTTRTDRADIASLRSRMRSMAGRPLKGTRTAPGLPLALAAEILELSESEVREMIRSRRLCEVWEIGDRGRELVVRPIDLIHELGRRR